MTFQNSVDPSVLDQLLEDTGGDGEFVAEIIDEYLINARSLLDALEHSLAREDASGARDAAHTLKGTSASLGAMPLSSFAAHVEALCKEATPDEATAVSQEMNELFARTEQALVSEKSRFQQ